MGTLINKLEITIGGKPYNDYNFLNIVLKQELLKPNELNFTMQKKLWHEGNAADGRFPIPKELIGGKVVLKVVTTRFNEKEDAEESETLEFKGSVFNVSVRHKSDLFSEQMIDVIAYSADCQLIDHPNCFSYEMETLKDIVNKTLKPHSIPNDISPRTTDAIPYTVQYNESSYQFLARLAQRYGEWMYNDGKKWYFGEINKRDKVKLEPRNDISNYTFQANVIHHKVKHAHHNYLTYENTSKSDSDVPRLDSSGYHELTDVAKDKASDLFAKETFQHLRCSMPEDNDVDELGISTKAQLYGEKTQQMICTGSTIRADLTIGSQIEIVDHFYDDSGKSANINRDLLIITSITHHADMHGEYSNRFVACSASSEYPPYFQSDNFPFSASQRAIVKDNKDPEKLGRIRVQFLWQEMQDDKLMTPWIRIAQPYGGGDKGFYFIPEIDEEVMVDFENGNAEKPYVAGTLYHGKEQRPDAEWCTDPNEIKAIRTRNGHTIEIHDEGDDGYIKIYDNEKENYILTFSTDEKLIKLESTGNIELYAAEDIIMEAKGNIKMKADSDITQEAGSNISEKANSDVSIEAGSNVSIKANKDVSAEASANMSMKANIKMSLESTNHEQKANASMKLDGGGMLEAKAGMVNIN